MIQNERIVMEYFELRNGMKIPAVGTGTNTFGKEGGVWGGELNGDFSPVFSALELGYRFFDSAIMYINDDGLGKALQESGYPREELTILSKFLYRQDVKPDLAGIRKEIDNCMKRLRTDYLDIFLIHEPFEADVKMEDVWKLFEEYYSEGKFKAIGISNFSPAQLDGIMSSAEILPMVNEIPCNGKTMNNENVKWCIENGIQPIAWGPLSNFSDSAKAVFSDIGKAHGKTWPQTALRYQIQRGVAVIPKSHKKDRQAHNIDLFDFSLTEEEMARIAADVKGGEE